MFCLFVCLYVFLFSFFLFATRKLTSTFLNSPQKDEQVPVAKAPAASTSRADRKCGRKTSNDAAWGSATDSGDKFIACLRQDDELLDFFNMQTDGGDASYFSDALEGDNFDKTKIKVGHRHAFNLCSRSCAQTCPPKHVHHTMHH